MFNLVRDTLGLIWLWAIVPSLQWSGTTFARGGGLVRNHSPRRVPLRGADERPLYRPTADSVRGRGFGRRACCAPHSRRSGCVKPPRKHYQWYYSTPQANDDMRHCPQGIHAFLRAYFHYKSADWKPNKPFPLRVE